MKEIGFYRMPDADTWSAKTPNIDARTGDFYLYGNDIARGLDIYKFEGEGRRSNNQGRWMTPAEAELYLGSKPRVPLTEDTAFFCLLPP
jgi:hypothetical protein